MFKVIAVTARELTPGGPTGFLDQVDRIAASGVAALILREKDLADDAYLALASQVAPLCRAHGVDFIPHGSIARAQALGCAKVQLPWLAFTAARAEGLIPASRDLQSPSPRASESRPSPKSQVPTRISRPPLSYPFPPLPTSACPSTPSPRRSARRRGGRPGS
ncbi:MAG: thiamine phosphate synthase [Treponema sp.]|nr:thiamine phosphate synthase [Treponema sp.]